MANIVIKTDFNGDLRRFTIETSAASFRAVYLKVLQFYSLKGAKLTYVDDEGDTVRISCDLELEQALHGASKGALKLIITEAAEEPLEEEEQPLKGRGEAPRQEPKQEKEMKKAEEPVIVPSATSVESANVSQQQLRAIVQEVLLSPPILDAIVLQVSQRLAVANKPAVSNTVPASVPAFSASSVPAISAPPPSVKPVIVAAPSQNQVPVVVQQQQQQPSLIDSIIRDTKEALLTTSQALESVLMTAPNNPVHVPAPASETKNVAAPEKPVSVSSPEPSNVGNAPAQPIPIASQAPPSSSSSSSQSPPTTIKEFLSSLIQPFSAPKDSQPQRADASAPAENPERPVPEELLQQLEQMGFGDREQNIKIARFHQKYNEGFEEILEDLLTQSQIQEQQAKK